MKRLGNRKYEAAVYAAKVAESAVSEDNNALALCAFKASRIWFNCLSLEETSNQLHERKVWRNGAQILLHKVIGKF